MTAKDLNLLTDPAALAEWARDNVQTATTPVNHTEHRSRPRADLNAVAETPAPQTAAASQHIPSNTIQPATNRPTPQPTHSNLTHTHRHWLLTAGIAVMNMLFLVLAGFWLSGTHVGDRTPTYTAPPTQVAVDTEPRLEELSQQLINLGQQMGELKAQITQLREQPAPVESQSTTPPSPAANVAAPTPEMDDSASVEPAMEAPVLWQVNLGDYTTRRTARATLAELAAMGLKAQVRQLEEAGKTIYLVTLDKFSSREGAEKVANDIMQKTQLNGLWVARSPH